jgi:glycine/D-amino acid oxidase-like deaminating enzyme
MTLTRLYHEDSYDPTRAVGSYWETTATSMADRVPAMEGDGACDVAIVGAGFTGLSAALCLAGDHGRDVVVLDAAWPGWGASGRNGGFCCVGGDKLSNREMTALFGVTETGKYRRAQLTAIDQVAQTLNDYGIDADRQGDGELQLAHRARDQSGFAHEAQYLKSEFGIEAELFDRQGLERLGAGGPEFHGGLLMRKGFGLNPMKYVQGLASAAVAAGARIHGHTPVMAVDLEDGWHKLVTPGGTLLAKSVIFATNGYSSENVPPAFADKLLPVFSNIMVTRPLAPDELAAQGWSTPHMAYDTRNLLHYFRLLPDGRFLFGARGGTRGDGAAQAHLRGRLRVDFNRMFPAWRSVEDTQFWSGLACLSRNLVPYIGPIGNCNSAWAGLAYHGNGVAMGSWSGRQLGHLVAGTLQHDALPSVVRGPLAKFPLAALRPLYLNLAYRWYMLRDEWL